MLIQSEKDWTAKHTKRRNELKNVFAKEEMRAYYADYRKRKPEKVAEAQKKAAEKEREEKALLEELERDIHENLVTGFGEGARHIPLPCGEDCRNCPVPGGPGACPYTDEDEDALMALEYPTWRDMEKKKKAAQRKARKREGKQRGERKT